MIAPSHEAASKRIGGKVVKGDAAGGVAGGALAGPVGASIGGNLVTAAGAAGSNRASAWVGGKVGKQVDNMKKTNP
ncbi:unnamed protein product, partial [Aphanomyces euteiches]